jgi:hypothetical protein
MAGMLVAALLGTALMSGSYRATHEAGFYGGVRHSAGRCALALDCEVCQRTLAERW